MKIRKGITAVMDQSIIKMGADMKNLPHFDHCLVPKNLMNLCKFVFIVITDAEILIRETCLKLPSDFKLLLTNFKSLSGSFHRYSCTDLQNQFLDLVLETILLTLRRFSMNDNAKAFHF